VMAVQKIVEARCMGGKIRSALVAELFEVEDPGGFDSGQKPVYQSR
jgi:hypothetical protein